MAISDHFSATYAEARAKFRAAAGAAGARLESYVNPNRRGPDGEELATDVALFGPADAAKALVTSSATHGVEGFCGSGCQVGAIREGLVRALPRDCALVVIHAINPYGFAWQRRVTEDNVDLNRNFVDFAAPPVNDAYDRVHGWLVPADWDGPARRAADQAIADFIAASGLPAFQAAVSGGQYRHADGLFYGGAAPTWSHKTFVEIVRRHLAGRRRLGFIDFHTGLGPSGYGEPIFPGPAESDGFARARDWFGPDVTSPEGGTSTSAVVVGTLKHGLDALLPGTEVAMIALEYGTVPIPEVIEALRGDHWLAKHGDPASVQGRAIKAAMRRAFYTETDAWKEKVYARAAEMTGRAFAKLAA
jgi:hypothetical protein